MTRRLQCTAISFCLISFLVCTETVFAFPEMRLSEWDRGISVDSIDHPEMRMYLWFYEWHMFGAIREGQHTRGNWKNHVALKADRRRAEVVSGNYGVKLDVDDGAELVLSITNTTARQWPPLASVIACFNPGPEKTRNRQFANTKTFFHAKSGLMPLAMKAPREIHYNHELRKAIDAAANDEGKYAWSSKWPKSDVDAVDGLIIRESTDGKWVTGIAWDRFLGAQGHNPWECMHLSIRVGPLGPKETRKVHGRIWLFEGTKQDLLKKFLVRKAGKDK